MTSTTIYPTEENLYFLVVPKNYTSEGSHGLTSEGFERPRGVSSCLPQDLASPCP